MTYDNPLAWPEEISEEMKEALMEWEHMWFDAEDDDIDDLIRLRQDILKGEARCGS